MSQEPTAGMIAAELLDQKRFRSAVSVLEETLAKVAHSPYRVMTAFNLGALYWAEIGDGEAARKLFQSVVEDSANSPAIREMVDRIPLEANSCENLMLLSLSYDEYQEWAERLRRLQPTSDILRGQLPIVREWRDEGHPWSFALQRISGAYYNRNDPKQDAGKYGCAKSICQLILKHRKPLRLSRDDWKTVTYEYGALTLRIASDCMGAMSKRGGEHDPDEYAFVVRDAIPLIEEYVRAYPADELRSDLVQRMRKFMGNLPEIRKEAHERAMMDAINSVTSRYDDDDYLRMPSIPLPSKDPGVPTPFQKDLAGRCRRCHRAVPNVVLPCPHCGFAPAGPAGTYGCVLGLVLFATLGWFVGRLTGITWLVYLGGAIGAFLGTGFGMWAFLRWLQSSSVRK